MFDPLSYLMGAKAAGGGGSSLPEVTAEDNGDVLTVVDGAWAKAAPSGGGNVLVATLTYNNDTSSYLIDKTYSEICAAMNAKTPIYIWCDDYGNAVMEMKPMVPNGNVFFSFFNIASMGGNPATYAIDVIRFTLSSTNTLTMKEYLADAEED